MTEDQLWTCQSTSPLANLISKSKALSYRQHSLYYKHIGAFLHLFIEDATFSLSQYTIHSAWYRKG